MKQKKWDAYIYGDVNIDLIVPGVTKFPNPGEEEEVPYMNTFVGGGAALFALGLGKLGLHPVFQGKVGADSYGRMIKEEFGKVNVDNSLLVTDQKQNTGISISFTNEKDRAFLTYRGTNSEIDIKSIELNQVKSARHIHVTGYSGRKSQDAYLSLLKQVKEIGDVTVSFDVGWDVSNEWYHGIYDLFPYIDVLFMNETESIHYGKVASAEEAARSFGESCPLVVIKLGKKGSFAYNQGTFVKAVPYTVTAVDTTGAGDSFNAGFIYGYLNGYSMEACLKCGNGCGALSVTALGGNTGFPNQEQLRRFIETQEQ